MADFTHLHVHTEFSLLDGLSNINDLIERAQKQKMKSLAVTDHGVMYGVVKFHNAARAAGIKPIIGVEGYLTTADLDDRTPGVNKLTYHQLLLAKNEVGYKNLMKLTTLAHLKGYYYRPRFTFKMLESHREGLITTSSCMQGIIPNFIRQGDLKGALKMTRYFMELFGEDFYLELQDHQGVPELKGINRELIKLSRTLGIPVVATNDVHYVAPDDAKAQDALLAVQTKSLLSDKDRLTMIDSPDYYLKSGDEMAKLFPEQPDALKNSMEIADKCNVTIETGKWILPDFPLPRGYQRTEKLLKDLALDGLKKRFDPVTKEQKDRLDYELKVICDKGFATYFLIVADFVNWAKQNKIRVGPGRGSVAGSLVAYAMRITTIDPLEHVIPFERFMNPERPSPPDIDLDFADDKRDQVIEYVAQKYGKDKVAQIITFGTMEARGSIRDIGRVLGMPYSDPDKVAKLIPVGYHIEEAMTSVMELQELYKQPEFKELIDLAKKVEGSARHASTHAAGVVVGDKPLTEYTPLQMESKGERVVTQYDMYSLDCNISPDAIGLLKMDFLGLRNLTILQNAIDFVLAETGKRVDMSEIPLDDKGVFKLLSSGKTIGIFQLESGGMRRVAKKLAPSRFSDITAMVALYRPGPMDLIDDFIEGKKNPASVKYPHPDLKEVLSETYGIAVYQEQALQIANVMAGYTLGEADILRRAIGKKKRSIMAKEKDKFIKGARAKGYTKEVAEKVWSYIDKFAGYGFNKAHATAYAMIAYQTAYMKAKYPVEFMAALLTAEVSNKDKVPPAIEEAKAMGIVILPPNINESGVGFSIIENKNSLNNKAIRFGLSAIKNVGEAAIGAILTARKKKPFVSLTDFCRRVDAQKVNKKVLESLVQVGAFDEFGKRSSLMMALENIRSKATDHQKQSNSPQVSLFASTKVDEQYAAQDNLPEAKEFSKNELLNFEKLLLGFYLTEHPMGEALLRIKEMVSHSIGELTEEANLNQTVTVGGTLTSVKKIFTKNSNKEMAFANLVDGSGTIELVVFPRTFAATRDVWEVDQPVLVTGKVDFKERPSLLVDSALTPGEKDDREVGEKFSDSDEAYHLKINPHTSKETLIEINQLLQNHPGKDSLVIELVNGSDQAKIINLPFTVNLAKVRSAVDRLLGDKGGEISQN